MKKRGEKDTKWYKNPRIYFKDNKNRINIQVTQILQLKQILVSSSSSIYLLF